MTPPSAVPDSRPIAPDYTYVFHDSTPITPDPFRRSIGHVLERSSQSLTRRRETLLPVGHRAVFVEGGVEDLVDERVRGQRAFVQFNAQARAVRHDEESVFQLDGLHQ